MGEATRIFLQQQNLNLPGDVEILVGEPDPRLKLAPCVRFEPFVPNGARLLGKTMLGVRCVEGANWSTYLPVQIKLYVSALVATRALKPGDPVTPEDVRTERLDLGTHPRLITDSAQLAGKILARPTLAGQPLSRDMLRAPIVLHAGDTVRLVYTGPGFALAAEGKATAQAAAGERVAVRTESGKIVNGIAREGKIAEVGP